jgi:hypothetical protein
LVELTTGAGGVSETFIIIYVLELKFSYSGHTRISYKLSEPDPAFLKEGSVGQDQYFAMSLRTGLLEQLTNG